MYQILDHKYSLYAMWQQNYSLHQQFCFHLQGSFSRQKCIVKQNLPSSMLDTHFLGAECNLIPYDWNGKQFH